MRKEKSGSIKWEQVALGGILFISTITAAKVFLGGRNNNGGNNGHYANGGNGGGGIYSGRRGRMLPPPNHMMRPEMMGPSPQDEGAMMGPGMVPPGATPYNGNSGGLPMGPPPAGHQGVPPNAYQMTPQVAANTIGRAVLPGVQYDEMGNPMQASNSPGIMDRPRIRMAGGTQY